MERVCRFGDHGELLRDPKDSATYFAGRFSDRRMDVIRRSIEEVRGQWSSYDCVPDSVRRFIDGIDLTGRDLTADQLIAPIEHSLRLNRDWDDRLPAGGPRREFPMIREYTSDRSYETLFSAINARYRSDVQSVDSKSFVPLTWLVELLNMELFAASRADADRTGDRQVYRGTVFPSQIKARYEIFGDPDTPLEDRCISIPLGLHSSSASRGVARDFLSRSLADRLNQGEFGVIWNIRIVSLAPERLALYHRHFPDSVVSRICATDISSLSAYPSEGEILLRGPFFEVLDFRAADPVGSMVTYELDAVMVDSNRDHVSTFELDKYDPAARSFFRAMVSSEKFSACAQLAKSLAKPNLAGRYAAAAQKAEQDMVRIESELAAAS
jgi:hypothetical protein